MVRLYTWWSSWSEALGGLWRTKRLFALAAAGQGLVEYAIVLALVAILVVGVVAVAGGRIAFTLSSVGADFGSPAMSAGPTSKPTATPKPTKTPKPTATPKPKKTPKPTKTP